MEYLHNFFYFSHRTQQLNRHCIWVFFPVEPKVLLLSHPRSNITTFTLDIQKICLVEPPCLFMQSLLNLRLSNLLFDFFLLLRILSTLVIVRCRCDLLFHWLGLLHWLKHFLRLQVGLILTFWLKWRCCHAFHLSYVYWQLFVMSTLFYNIF